MFYYLIKLHYSQTIDLSESTQKVFYYLIKLHYSQTEDVVVVVKAVVLLPYKITLLSNMGQIM